MLTKKRWLWLIWLVVLLLSAYVVPYYFIGDKGKVNASFLYWSLYAIAAIISTIKITTYWRD